MDCYSKEKQSFLLQEGLTIEDECDNETPWNGHPEKARHQTQRSHHHVNSHHELEQLRKIKCGVGHHQLEQMRRVKGGRRGKSSRRMSE
eukprot:scaffold34134_cov73-Isochrysis_galbana.AAC.1